MSDLTRLRLVWEPRLLSITRIMIGLLFMEHGTAKVLDFPHQETHKIFDLLTLNPGAQGLIELIGGTVGAVGGALSTPAPAYGAAPRYRRTSYGGCGASWHWVPGHHNRWGEWRPGHCSPNY